MKAKQMRELVIKPALERLDLTGEPAETLLLATACVESRCGAAIKQWPSGPALGIFQIEPATYDDLLLNYLAFRPDLNVKLMSLYCAGMTAEENLTCNLIFQAAVCRLIYLRAPEKIPETLSGMAAFWKRFYNTPAGKGTEAKFLEAYGRYGIE